MDSGVKKKIDSMFADTYKFCIKCFEMESTDANWEGVLAEAPEIEDKHGIIVKNFLVDIMNEADHSKRTGKEGIK